MEDISKENPKVKGAVHFMRQPFGSSMGKYRAALKKHPGQEVQPAGEKAGGI